MVILTDRFNKMSSNTNKSNNIFNQSKDLCASQTTLQEPDADGKVYEYRFLSELDHIRLMRESYKEYAERTFQELKANEELQLTDRLDAAEKAVQLLDSTRIQLQELDERRKEADNLFTETMRQVKLLRQQMPKQNMQMDELTNAQTLMRELLDELKR